MITNFAKPGNRLAGTPAQYLSVLNQLQPQALVCPCRRFRLSGHRGGAACCCRAEQEYNMGRELAIVAAGQREKLRDWYRKGCGVF